MVGIGFRAYALNTVGALMKFEVGDKNISPSTNLLRNNLQKRGKSVNFVRVSS